MNLDQEINLARRARACGDQFYRDNNFSKAFANYLLALTIKNDWANDLKEVFIHSLCEWGRILEYERKFSNLFSCYEEALKLYPSCEVIQNNLGAHLLRMNHFKEASLYFCEALNLNSSYLPAFKNLESLSNKLIERWHFRMLNDTNRNECFRRAIHAKINKGFTSILDVGTGTGLLSLFAAEMNPKCIYACDYSQVMASIASDIMKSNGISDKVKIFNKLSNNLRIPDDIPDKVDLLVMEIVDAGLIGEGILQTLDDVWERLLVPDFDEIPKKLRVIPERASLYIVPVECSYLRRQFKYVCDNSQYNCIPPGISIMIQSEEPYDTIDLKSFTYTFLSEPTTIFNFDFNSPREIKEYLEGKRNIEMSLKCNECGILDAFCVWFDLYLNDCEIITTTPFSENESCWEQAIFPVTKNITVTRDAKVDFKINITDGKLSLINYNIENCNSDESLVFKVSKDLLLFLNSETTLNKLNLLYDELIKVKDVYLNVLDTTIYPYIGLKCLEKGSQIISLKHNEIDLQFLKMCHRVKCGNPNMYSSHSFESLVDCLKDSPKLDIVVIDLLDSHGELNDSWLMLYPLVKNNLHKNSIIFPEDVIVHCQLVHSNWLENSSRLNNKSLLEEYTGFNAINNFKVKHFIDLDINKLKHTKKSHILDIAKINIDNLFSELLQEFTASIEITEDGPVNSILYWFSYGNKRVRISTNAEDFYRHQSAEIFDKPLFVMRGDFVNLKLQLMSCILKFNVVQ